MCPCELRLVGSYKGEPQHSQTLIPHNNDYCIVLFDGQLTEGGNLKQYGKPSPIKWFLICQNEI